MNTSLTKSCSVFGHRKINISNELKEVLRKILEEMIQSRGVEVFYFGGFGDFDDLCYQVVSELKDKYPHIKRIFCLYDPRHQKKSKRPKWLQEEEYEEYLYLDMQFDCWYTRIYYRNCEIIKNSDFVLFYVINKSKSGAYKAMQYAKKRKKQYINVANVI